MMHVPVDVQDSAVVMTSSPGSTPAAATAMCNAAVPLFVAKQYFTPQ